MAHPRNGDRPAGAMAALHQRIGGVAGWVVSVLKPTVTLGVRLAAFDADGRLFLVRHSYLPGWHLPGGAVDVGESCGTAVAREAAEEGGLQLAGSPELFGLYWNPGGGKRDHIVLFLARGAAQPVPWKPSLEIRAAGFHPLDALPDGVTPATLRRLAEVRGGPRDERW